MTAPVVGALPTPHQLREELPMPAATHLAIARHRVAVARILHGNDPRLLVVVGPCSVHDVAAAREYAEWLRDVALRYDDRLMCVMRVYVEKARTRGGWKGLLPDPRLDDSGQIDEGLRIARGLLVDLASLVPVAAELVGTSTASWIDDTLSWAAIGARTVASPAHREVAAALPCPVGFKNSIDGNIHAAIDAVTAARARQRFIGLDAEGRAAIVQAPGNPCAHIVLRGGRQPNCDRAAIDGAESLLRQNGLPPRMMVDAGHANSEGDYRNQLPVAAALAASIADGSRAIVGVMIESNLVAGRQHLLPNRQLLTYGQSVTDGCLDRSQTIAAFDLLAAAMAQRHRSG